MPITPGAWVMSGGSLVRKGRPSRTPPTGPTYAARGPVSVTDVNQLQSLGLATIPSDANLVNWHWATGTDLNTVFNQLAATDILVLPEDNNPYVVGQMYRTSDGTATGTNPTTDLSACRAKRGIIGLGPNAVIAPATNFPTYAAQTGNGGVRESLVECWTANPYFANFTIKGKNVGGLAYHGLKCVYGHNGTIERVKTTNHYGFKNAEPGEAFGLTSVNHDGTFHFRNCEVDGRNQSTLAKEGSGGIHLDRGANVVVENCYVHGVRGHGIANFWRLGSTVITDTVIEDVGTASIHGNGINIEVSGTNPFTISGGAIRLLNGASGNVGAHLAAVACSTTGDLGAWPLGRTPVSVSGVAVDTSSLTVWTANGGSGTYHGAANVEQNSDVTVTGTPVTYSGFLG